MPGGPLLLIVQATCATQCLEAFNLWYNSHLPNLLRIPGYLWAQRYVCLDDRNRFMAIYGVRSYDDLPSLVHWDGPDLHPIAKAEFAGSQGLQGISLRVANFYEQISGSPLRDPLLLSDRPLGTVTTDVDPAHEREWNRWYDESHVPNLLVVPGRVMAGRFRTLAGPATDKFNTGPRYLTLYECESEEMIPSLRPGPQMGPEARAEFQRAEAMAKPHMYNYGSGYYKLISKHFKWMEE